MESSKNAKELKLTRTFNAPRAVVFRAWVDVKQVARWWGPKGFTNPVCYMDVRPGGAIRIDMRGPDGIMYPMSGIFEEIVEPEKLVFTAEALDKNGKPLFQVLNTITFTEKDGSTTLTLHASVGEVTEESTPYIQGMDEGWNQSLDRLEAEVTAA